MRQIVKVERCVSDYHKELRDIEYEIVEFRDGFYTLKPIRGLGMLLAVSPKRIIWEY